MIIDTSYFEGDLSIGQISSPAVIASVNLFIKKYEDEFLAKLLGYPLFKLFKAGIAAETPDQRYLDIKTGVEYEYSGHLNKWRGLTFESDGLKRSPIANYVYWFYMKDNASFTMGAGEVKPENSTSENVSPKLKMIRAWNEMAHMNRELAQMIIARRDVYPEYMPVYSGIFKTVNEFGI